MAAVINTPLQQGVWWGEGVRNRFNGFPHDVETVETVSLPLAVAITPLKRGDNERCLAWIRLFAVAQPMLEGHL